MRLPLGLAAAGCLGMFTFAWLRFEGFHSEAFDLAYFDQAVWNAAQGHGFVSSFNPYPFLGQHFSPALILVVPLYLIHPSAVWLLAVQSLALGLAVLPLYRLAVLWIGPELAWIAGVAYLLQLFVARAVEFDFHTEALAVPFVFWAILAAARADSRTLLLAGSFPMLCKEDGALVSLGVAVVAVAICRRPWGFALMALAVIYAAVISTLAMPALRGGAPSDIVLRYHYLGSTVPEIALGLVKHPAAVAAQLLTPGPLVAAALALGGLAFLPLLRPWALAAAAPPALLALLSQAPAQHQLLYQYGLQPGALLVVAALLGWQRLNSRPQVGAALLAAAAVILAVAGPHPALDGLQRRTDAAALLARIPPGDSVAASRNVLTMLAERPDIAQFPAYGKSWVVLDTTAEPPAAGAGLPAHGYQMVAESAGFSIWRQHHA